MAVPALAPTVAAVLMGTGLDRGDRGERADAGGGGSRHAVTCAGDLAAVRTGIGLADGPGGRGDASCMARSASWPRMRGAGWMLAPIAVDATCSRFCRLAPIIACPTGGHELRLRGKDPVDRGADPCRAPAGRRRLGIAAVLVLLGRSPPGDLGRWLVIGGCRPARPLCGAVTRAGLAQAGRP